ncbi:MAG TPA: zf-HC2 domain-containing protein [Armatimonadota bacterium]|nr:zf-HC2 domain-containing protein [Armatimonadota bacterium]
MNCHKVQSLMSAYVDSEIPGVEMLAVRQHLNQCSECNREFEALLRIKRAFGTLQPRRPVADLPIRIFQRLDQVSHTPHGQFLASLGRRFNFFPAKMRFAAVGMAVLTALLMVRSSQITPSYTAIPMSPAVAVNGMVETNSVQLLPATSMVEAASFNVPKFHPTARPWDLSEKPSEPTDLTAGPGMLLAGYASPL